MLKRKQWGQQFGELTCDCMAMTLINGKERFINLKGLSLRGIRSMKSIVQLTLRRKKTLTRFYY
jgi:hypothetical protein